MELVTMNVADIRPYENNPRINDEAVKAVAESIRQCGYVAPIIVDEDNVILAGHTRLKALMTLGRREVEVIIRAGLSDDQKRKYRLLDNKTTEWAEWDLDKLEIELDGLDFDGFDFGFDIPPTREEVDGGDIDDKTDEPVAVRIVFDNAEKFRHWESELRDMVDQMDGATVSVGAYED